MVTPQRRLTRTMRIQIGASNLENILQPLNVRSSRLLRQKQITGISMIQIPADFEEAQPSDLLLFHRYQDTGHAASIEGLTAWFQSSEAPKLVLFQMDRGVQEVPEWMNAAFQATGVEACPFYCEKDLFEVFEDIAQGLGLFDTVKIQLRDALYTRLLEAVNQGSRIENILSVLRLVFEKEVFLLNKNLRVIAPNHQSALQETLKKEETLLLHAPPGVSYHWSKDDERVSGRLFCKYGKLSVWLCLDGYDARPGKMVLSMAETAASFLTMEYALNHSAYEFEKQYKLELLDIATGMNKIPTEAFLERTRLMGWYFQGEFTVVRIRLEPVRNAAGKPGTELSAEELCGKLPELLKDNGVYYFRPARQSLYFIAQFPSGTQARTQRVLLGALEQTVCLLEDQYKSTSMTVGIGRTVTKISDIRESYRQAGDAIQVANTAGKKILAYQTMGISKLLCEISKTAKLDDYIPDGLKVLLAYDSENGTTLYQTLAAYYECSSNAALASKKLFIHYKTMLNRLSKISEISELDLKDSIVRLDLENGIHLLKLKEPEDSGKNTGRKKLLTK